MRILYLNIITLRQYKHCVLFCSPQKIMTPKHFILLFFFFGLTIKSFGQIDPYTAVGLGTSLGKGIFNKIKDGKKKKNIEAGLTTLEINGTTHEILRVREDKIISNAKGYIVRIQNTLAEYYKQYQSNQHIDLPYYFDDNSVLKSVDSDWPTEYYENEFKEYQRYEKALSKREQRLKDSLEYVRRIEQKRISDSISIVRKKESDSLAFVERVKGFYFVNKDYILLKEKPSENSKTIGKIFSGSYIKVLGYSDNSKYIKVTLQDIEGYVEKNDIVDDLDKLSVSNSDLTTYKSRQYYKYEPNYDYVKEDKVSYSTSSSFVSGSTKTTKQKINTSTKKRSYTQSIRYIRGPRGGCYYITSGGTKTYVDRSYCN